MKEILLCKYGELVLKGANRRTFEEMLARDIRKRAVAFGAFEVTRAQGTIRIEPTEDGCDLDGLLDSVCRVFGLVGVERCAVCEKTVESIAETAKAYLPASLQGKKTFKVECKRSDKTFPLDSIALAREIGGEILSACPWLRVNVHEPEVTIRVEVRETNAYVSAGQIKGAGGIPLGSSGRGLLLLSGGIDSPVAGYMMAKRGMVLEALHFESFPYTSEQAREKVLELAGLVSRYAGDIRVHVISLTHVQEELVRACEEDYFTLLLRRYMMALADRVAKEHFCDVLITGESLGQVASQTVKAIGVTNPMTDLPVFRPCIGLDKEEIVQVARRIGTFETSILPYEDCCTVFTPRHPRTRPDPVKVKEQEDKLDFNALVDEAMGTLKTYVIKARP
jgi:thiamine biosynthesis protein ThiI